MVVNTVNGGLMTDASGNSKYIGKIKYNSNADKNGHECFAWQLNYFKDENMESFYSQGFQYETLKTSDKLDFYTYEDFSNDLKTNEYKETWDNFIYSNDINLEKKFLWKGNYLARYVDPYLANGLVNNYQSTDNFGTLETTNPILESSVFTIQISNNENDLVYMQFLGDGHADYGKGKYTNSRELLGTYFREGTFVSEYNYFYYNYSADWFGYYLYNAVQTLPAGTKGTYTFEFGDFFKFYDVNDDGTVGKEIKSEEERAKVIEKVKSYFVFEVEISSSGARSSSDSMFGVLHNSPNYSVDGYDGTNGDYSFGTTIIDLDVYDFELVKINETDVMLKLKEEFVNKYKAYADKIYLNIKVDKTLLSAQGYNYIGFVGNSGLESFQIYEITEI